VSEPTVSKALVRRLKHLLLIRHNHQAETKGIKLPAQWQIHLGEQRILWPLRINHPFLSLIIFLFASPLCGISMILRFLV
jgi:hypothetical protein